MKYLLPCACGKSVSVEISQAGQSVRCSCGNTLDVPAMRLVRQLPVDNAGAPSKAKSKRSWSIFQGIFFAVGLPLLVGGLATAAVFQWGRFQLNTEEGTWDDLMQDQQSIDQWSIDQSWEAWTRIRDDSIGPYAPPTFIENRQIAANWYQYVVNSLKVAGVGLFFLLAAYVAGFATKPSARRATRPTAVRH